MREAQFFFVGGANGKRKTENGKLKAENYFLTA